VRGYRICARKRNKGVRRPREATDRAEPERIGGGDANESVGEGNTAFNGQKAMGSDEIITITGHRIYPDRASLYQGLDRIHAKQYYFGGARGIDSDALEYLARTQTASIKTVVVPNRVIDQTFSSREIMRLYADEIIELKNTGPERYMIRNKFMVDRSTRVEAFYDFRGHGGTFNTIRYSEATGKPFKVNPLVEFRFNDYMNMSEISFRNWVKMMKRLHVNVSAVKGIILSYIQNILNTTVHDFATDMGCFGCNSIEQLMIY